MLIDWTASRRFDRLKQPTSRWNKPSHLLFVVEHGARILKNFASARSYVANLPADSASTQRLTVASYG
jgi:hypothetical protein